VTYFYLLVALATLVLLLLIVSLYGAWRRRRVLPYTLEHTLFAPDETAFLAALDEAVGGDYRVFGKVRLSDLVAVRRGAGKRVLAQASARIEPLTIDFLVCGRESARVVCAIALVGGRLRRGRTHAADKALGRACDALGLPLVRVAVAETYSAKALADQIYTAIYAPKLAAPAGGHKGAGADDGLSRAEEEQALSVLAAAIRDGDPVLRPQAS
jgi:hypothetical protein